MKEFNEIKNLSDYHIQLLLKNIELNTLVRALTDSSVELKNKVLNNVSKKAFDVINDEIEKNQNLSSDLIFKAQQNMIDTANTIVNQ